MLKDTDTLIIGAGFAGAVAARILADNGEKILLLDKRNHIGGNCFDKVEPVSGALIHIYGPHLFHTDNKDAWNFMERFSEMEVYEHKVKADIDGKFVPLPFSFETLYKVFPAKKAEEIETALLEKYEYGKSASIMELRGEDSPALKSLAEFIYEKVFLHYTMKQWGKTPDEIDQSVTARVPIKLNRDTRYFADRYQGVPKYGYTALFENMLNHKNIHILLNTNASEVLEIKENKTYFCGEEFNGKVIYTGALDELFNYEYGSLPYRSVKMAFETLNTDNYQEVATQNYPNNYDFTRITEFKKIHPAFSRPNLTTILKEYPQNYEKGKNTPYYPIFNAESRAAYEKYEDKAKKIENLTLLGRLAEYKYYDMDDIIIRVMEKVSSL